MINYIPFALNPYYNSNMNKYIAVCLKISEMFQILSKLNKIAYLYSLIF